MSKDPPPRPPERSSSDWTEPLPRGQGRSGPVPLGAPLRGLDAAATPPMLRHGVGTCTIGSAPGCDRCGLAREAPLAAGEGGGG